MPQAHVVTNLVACAGCNLVQRVPAPAQGVQTRCARCGMLLQTRKPNSIARTAALSLAALLLYVPANTYPIMRMTYMGRASENTIWSGCRQLFHDGDYAVAVVVFCASILIPLLKLESLQTAISGGIQFATPDDENGAAAVDGAIFTLYEKGDASWLEWAPAITLADSTAGDQGSPPQPDSSGKPRSKPAQRPHAPSR